MTTDYGPAEMLQANTPTKPRLLVLDEDRIILQSLSQFLRREGYDVRTTDSPDDAISPMRITRTDSGWFISMTR